MLAHPLTTNAANLFAVYYQLTPSSLPYFRLEAPTVGTLDPRRHLRFVFFVRHYAHARPRFLFCKSLSL